MAMPHMRTKETTLKSKLEKQACATMTFLLCGSFHNYKSVRTATVGEKLRLRQLRSVSYGFVDILYSSRLILLYSDHLEGRQTVENHLIHMGTSSYRCTHIMTSSISIS